MAGLRYADIQRRPLEVLDMTSLTVDEFAALVPPFEAAFQAHMADWRMDGLPRTRRQWSSYANSPLPTPQDRLLFILAYIKTYPLQVVHGRLFGMPQNKANQWIHVLLPVLQHTLQQLGDTPSRTVAALEAQLAHAAVVADPAQPPPAAAQAEAPADAAAPLLTTTAPNGASNAPKTRLSKRAVIAARKRPIR